MLKKQIVARKRRRYHSDSENADDELPNAKQIKALNVSKEKLSGFQSMASKIQNILKQERPKSKSIILYQLRQTNLQNKQEARTKLKEKNKMIADFEQIVHVSINDSDPNLERLLKNTATKGVLQFLNIVQKLKQQKKKAVKSKDTLKEPVPKKSDSQWKALSEDFLRLENNDAESDESGEFVADSDE